MGKEEELKRKQLEEEKKALEDDFERARSEMQGLLARNRELVDENEGIRTKLYYLEQNTQKPTTVDACVGENVETEDAWIGTDVVFTRDSEVNTDKIQGIDRVTDTLGLLEIVDNETMTDPERIPINLQPAFIFPMFR